MSSQEQVKEADSVKDPKKESKAKAEESDSDSDSESSSTDSSSETSSSDEESSSEGEKKDPQEKTTEKAESHKDQKDDRSKEADAKENSSNAPHDKSEAPKVEEKKEEALRKFELRVFTGTCLFAGTDSNVYLEFYGTEDTIREFVTGSEIKQTPRTYHLRTNAGNFERASVDIFQVNLNEHQQIKGELSKILIWTDNYGLASDWFLDKLRLEDLATKRSYWFGCNRWINKKSNGMILTCLKPEQIYIVVPEARDLLETKQGRGNPWVKVEYGSQEAFTHVELDTSNPLWDCAVYSFNKENDVKKIRIQVRRGEFGKDEPVGQVEIDLTPLGHSAMIDSWFNMEKIKRTKDSSSPKTKRSKKEKSTKDKKEADGKEKKEKKDKKEKKSKESSKATSNDNAKEAPKADTQEPETKKDNEEKKEAESKKEDTTKSDVKEDKTDNKKDDEKPETKESDSKKDKEETKESTDVTKSESKDSETKEVTKTDSKSSETKEKESKKEDTDNLKGKRSKTVKIEKSKEDTTDPKSTADRKKLAKQRSQTLQPVKKTDNNGNNSNKDTKKPFSLLGMFKKQSGPEFTPTNLKEVKDRPSGYVGKLHVKIFYGTGLPDDKDGAVFFDDDETLANIKTGDLLAFCGVSPLSAAIKLKTNTPFSHVAVAARIPDPKSKAKDAPLKLMLFESTNNSHDVPDYMDGTVRRGMTVFELKHRLHHIDSMAIWHIPLKEPLTKDQAKGMLDWLWSLHKKEIKYDKLQLIPFWFNIGNKEDLKEMFCSEMVASALRAAKRLPPNANPSNFSPCGVALSDCFEQDETKHKILKYEVVSDRRIRFL